MYGVFNAFIALIALLLERGGAYLLSFLELSSFVAFTISTGLTGFTKIS